MTDQHEDMANAIRALAMEAGADIVSMPSWWRLDRQPRAYRDDILPSGPLRVSIEAGTTQGWERYSGLEGLRLGVDSFGASAPAEALYRHFGGTVDRITPQIMVAVQAGIPSQS